MPHSGSKDFTTVSSRSLVQQVHAALAGVVREGDAVIDATVGNGHDALFLAERVGESGTVYGFDIQQQALDAAYARLQQEGLERRASLYHAGHEVMAMVLPPTLAGRIRAVVFNLGYLPGGDKARTTGVHTTLAALEQARELLMPGGAISVLAYTGHPGGREEAEAVKAWAATLSPDYYRVQLTIPPSQSGNAPEWVWIVRV